MTAHLDEEKIRDLLSFLQFCRNNGSSTNVPLRAYHQVGNLARFAPMWKSAPRPSAQLRRIQLIRFRFFSA